MNGGFIWWDFVIYSIYSVNIFNMHARLVTGMHEYLVRLYVFIFVWVLSTAFLWCVSSEWPGETVYLPRLLWVIDVRIPDSFVLLIGMHFKSCALICAEFYNSLKSKYILHLKKEFCCKWYWIKKLLFSSNLTLGQSLTKIYKEAFRWDGSFEYPRNFAH